MQTSKKKLNQHHNCDGKDDEPLHPVVTPGAVHIQGSGHPSFISQKRTVRNSDRTRNTRKNGSDRGRVESSDAGIETGGVLPGAVRVTSEDGSPSSFISQKRSPHISDRTSNTSKSSGRKKSRAEASSGDANSERQRSGGVLPGANHVTSREDSSPSFFISQKRSDRTSNTSKSSGRSRAEASGDANSRRHRSGGVLPGANHVTSNEDSSPSSFISQKRSESPRKGTHKNLPDDEDSTSNQHVENIEQPTILEDIKEEIQVQPQEDIQITTAQVVDEEELEREFTSKKSAEIRNQILSDAATATEVTKEKTFCQKYCACFVGCALIVIIIAIVLGVTLPKDKEPEPLEGYDYLLDLVSPISEKEVLLNETTPQFVALNWLAFEDTAGIPLAETNSDFLATSLEERYVVALLYFSTGGINWTSTHNFLSNASICEWPSSITDDNETVFDGIRCNEEGFVDSITLESNNIQGSIPSEISTLKSLQTLRLSNNGLRGPMPSALATLPILQRLYLDQNDLTGEIPASFGGLGSLEALSLWGNSLDGTIPNTMMSLPRLEEIVIGQNFFTGSIPDFLPRGPMKRIKMDYNFLVGTIPDTIYQLSSLEEIVLESNDLEGAISSKIGNLVSLKNLGFWRNNFIGSLPSQIGKMKDLAVLDIATNGIDHTMPTQLGQLDRLEVLALEENALTGTIPSQLRNLPNLWKLTLNGNLLSGLMPSELGGLASLRDGGVIQLHNNSLTGSLDNVFCSGEDDDFGLLTPLMLTADCDEIDCPCCTDCCDDITGSCTIDVGAICEGLAYEAENFLALESWGTMCQCRDGGEMIGSNGEEEEEDDDDDDFIYLECADACHSCNAEGKLCLEKYNYGFDLPKSTGLDNLYSCSMRYIADDEDASYRNEEILYKLDYLTFECSMSINGIECASCLAGRLCADGYIGYLIDCTNIEADAVYDDCSQEGLDGGELLQFLRPEYFDQDCIPCIF